MKRILSYHRISYDELVNKMRRIANMNDLRFYKLGPFFWVERGRFDLFTRRRYRFPLAEGFIHKKSGSMVTLRLTPAVWGVNPPTFFWLLLMTALMICLSALHPPFYIYLLFFFGFFGLIALAGLINSCTEGGQHWAENALNFIYELQQELENPVTEPQRKDLD